jgi:hypothetical protein
MIEHVRMRKAVDPHIARRMLLALSFFFSFSVDVPCFTSPSRSCLFLSTFLDFGRVSLRDMFALRFYPGLRNPEDFGRASSSLGFRNQEVPPHGFPNPPPCNDVLKVVAFPRVARLSLHQHSEWLVLCSPSSFFRSLRPSQCPPSLPFHLPWIVARWRMGCCYGRSSCPSRSPKRSSSRSDSCVCACVGLHDTLGHAPGLRAVE